MFFSCMVFFQGKTAEDEDNGTHGEGQLLAAMIANFIKSGGCNNIIGFTLSPNKVHNPCQCL